MILNFLSNFGIGAGYSSSVEKIAVYLEMLGYDIRVMRYNKVAWKYLTKEGKKLYRKEFVLGPVGFAAGFPPVFTSLFNKVKLGHTMFETDKLPDEGELNPNWTDLCNKMDRLIVPSKHSKDLFINSGVKIPVDVVHLGVDTRLYRRFTREDRDTFTFLMTGKLTIRKNPGTILSAFLSLFADKPNVKLILKTVSGTLGHIQLPNKNVIIIDRIVGEKEMLDYYRGADCFVFPTRGEGFGLPPIEAMATGLPTIIPNHTGTKEFADERFSYVLKNFKKVPAVRYPKDWGNVGNWYDCDYKEVKDMMWHIYKHQDEAKKKGRDAAFWVRDNWGYDKTASQLDKIIKKLV